MLPGLRLVLVAITATILIVVLGFAQLVKLQVAQSYSENLGPVEARFAGLAFAARADWTPIPTAPGRSMELLAPFVNISPGPAKPDGENRPAAALTAKLPRLAALPPAGPEPRLEVPSPEPAPLVVASISPTVDPSMPETASIRPPAEVTASDTADAPFIDAAALPPPPADPTPTLPAVKPPELEAAALPQMREFATASEARSAIVTPPAPSPVAPAPTETTVDDSDAAAAPEPSTPGDTVTASIPRPAAASAPGATVPMPVARPASAPPQPPKAQKPPVKKKAAQPSARKRAPAKQAQPAANTASTNPFAALFGGPNTTASPSN